MLEVLLNEPEWNHASTVMIPLSQSLPLRFLCLAPSFGTSIQSFFRSPACEQAKKLPPWNNMTGIRHYAAKEHTTVYEQGARNSPDLQPRPEHEWKKFNEWMSVHTFDFQ